MTALNCFPVDTCKVLFENVNNSDVSLDYLSVYSNEESGKGSLP